MISLPHEKKLLQALLCFRSYRELLQMGALLCHHESLAMEPKSKIIKKNNISIYDVDGNKKYTKIVK